MRIKLFAAAMVSGALVMAQEKTEEIKSDRSSARPPVSFQKDPRQSRPEQTTQIVTNSAKGGTIQTQKESTSVDDDIRQRVLVSLSTGSVGTQGIISSDQLTDIQVNVSNRVVTLKGDVISERNKSVIAKRVAGMDGVARVNNQLTVNPKAKVKGSDLYKPDGYSPGKQNGVPPSPKQ